MTEKITKAITIIWLGTALIGGHLTASFILLDIEEPLLSIYGNFSLLLIFSNIIAFIIALALQLGTLPNRQLIMRRAFLLLLNIPLAILYIICIIFHEF